ncbi:VOC family protein [Ornithinimicrobium sp. Y1847]|uniref:VOC family protein n=1 Tax=Ornithinimicrobium sp. Y1847 TaxID=3405419 RepID=UPI003B673411
MSTHGWQGIAGVCTAWFGASSLVEGAALAARVLDLAPTAAVDLRASGVLVRLDGDTHLDVETHLDVDSHLDAITQAAEELGLVADPSVPQQIGVVIETAQPEAVQPFWQRALARGPGEDGHLADPLRRLPPLRIREVSGLGGARNRIHLDVVRPAAQVEQTDLGPATGPYGVCHRDADGNEVDLVPGDPLGEAGANSGTEDWQVVFGAVAAYRVQSPARQRDLAVTAAEFADEAGFPLLIDLRPGVVVLDTGKDRWDADAHRLDVDFVDLAARLQTAARGLGATADAGLASFVQLFFDATDIESVRRFWAAALGYVEDEREGLTDIYDPRWLGPPLVFQPLDPADADRREQRDRMHVEVTVGEAAAQRRVEAAVAAGGRVLEESAGRWVVADPEGNELAIRSPAT